MPLGDRDGVGTDGLSATAPAGDGRAPLDKDVSPGGRPGEAVPRPRTQSNRPRRGGRAEQRAGIAAERERVLPAARKIRRRSRRARRRRPARRAACPVADRGHGEGVRRAGHRSQRRRHRPASDRPSRSRRISGGSSPSRSGDSPNPTDSEPAPAIASRLWGCSRDSSGSIRRVVDRPRAGWRVSASRGVRGVRFFEGVTAVLSGVEWRESYHPGGPRASHGGGSQRAVFKSSAIAASTRARCSGPLG